MTDLLKRSLSKWPMLAVVGSPVTTDQAMEIIIRTGHLEPSTNDTEFHEQIISVLYEYISGDKLNFDRRDKWHMTTLNELREGIELFGILPLEYLVTDRVASCYVRGPHGWIDWDGTVATTGTNIGKWPSVEAVLSEWCMIAEAFPYLDLQCQLYSGEGCEDDTEPVVQFNIGNGKVVLCEPGAELKMPEGYKRYPTWRTSERGCTIEKYKEALHHTFSRVLNLRK